LEVKADQKVGGGNHTLDEEDKIWQGHKTDLIGQAAKGLEKEVKDIQQLITSITSKANDKSYNKGADILGLRLESEQLEKQKRVFNFHIDLVKKCRNLLLDP